jgi:A/G-specific adenine glycosylase
MAYAQNRTKDLPTPKPRKAIPQKQTTMLIILHGNEVLLEKRPPSGIWGGLWSLPEIDMQKIATEVVATRYGLQAEAEEPLALVQHAFTHFKLEILPQPLRRVLGQHGQARGCIGQSAAKAGG